MPRRRTKRERGVYEKEPGSDIWWIRYKVDGVLHREKVGRFKDASDLYKIRKADALRGIKLPLNLKQRGIRFKEIGDDAVAWYENHGQKDLRSFRLRMKMIFVDFADRPVEEIKPSEIDHWLGQHDWAPATKNRYKSVFSKAFKLALADGKVNGNPDRLVQQRPEKNGRLRFLSAEEEQRLREAIAKRCPHHMEELDISLHTGMRKGEQYSLEWPQVSFRRKRILLEETKNGSSREVPMNKTCTAALERLHARREHDGRIFQSKYSKDLNDSREWFGRCIVDAKITNFTWHCLRHTFISRLVMAGVDLRTVQELAGHKTISMTVRYAHLAPEHNQAAIEKLDAITPL